MQCMLRALSHPPALAASPYLHPGSLKSCLSSLVSHSHPHLTLTYGVWQASDTEEPSPTMPSTDLHDGEKAQWKRLIERTHKCNIYNEALSISPKPLPLSNTLLFWAIPRASASCFQDSLRDLYHQPHAPRFSFTWVVYVALTVHS